MEKICHQHFHPKSKLKLIYFHNSKKMNAKTILLLGLFLALALLVCSEATAATSEEGAKIAVDDAKYQGGGYGVYPGGSRGGNGGGGHNGGRGRRGGYCRYGCCGRSYNGCRCCNYAGQKMEAEPHN